MQRPEAAAEVYSSLVLVVVAYVVLTFMLVPTFFVIPVSFTAGSFMSLPPQGSVTAVVSGVFRFAYVVERYSAFAVGSDGDPAVSHGSWDGGGVCPCSSARARPRCGHDLILAPLILPRIITAVALFYLFARMGLVGSGSWSRAGPHALRSPQSW